MSNQPPIPTEKSLKKAKKKLKKAAKKMIGGSFLVRNTNPKNVFIPEEWNEEQLMMKEAVHEFIMQEIIPHIDDLDEQKDPTQMPKILEKAGEMGFCALGVDEEYGGLDMKFNSGLLFSEAVALGFCFATVIGAQTSIGSLPILYYGTKEQKDKYMPKIATAEWKAAYCLTEPSAGSDANSGKTKAVMNEAGTHYMLNGQKMWITNGGFADIFIVFAKIADDEKLSAFIVEKTFGGITLGAEEKKMGIKGSSTVQLFFNDCPVPAENLLGEREGGFKMALNILNTGRIKLAASTTGGCKMATAKSIQYAKERLQFGQPIAEFGAIKHKIAEMATRTFVSESGTYRTGYNIDQKYQALLATGLDKSKAKLEAIREYAIECSIMKVYASEAVTYVIDEAVQIHGGMGYSQEMGIERGYRDARITRIYEGTNEINRMLSVGELMKRAFKDKKIDLVSPVKALPKYLAKQFVPFQKKQAFSEEARIVDNMKQVFLAISGRAGQKFGLELEQEQEIVMNLADILAEAYVSESALLRVQKLKDSGKEDTALMMCKYRMLQLHLYESLDKVRKAGKDAIMSFSDGMEQTLMLQILNRLTPNYQINPKELRRQIADYVLANDIYNFQMP